MLIIKHQGAYYTDKYEIQGTVIMICHSNVKEQAKVFNNEEEIKEETKNMKNYEYEVEEI